MMHKKYVYCCHALDENARKKKNWGMIPTLSWLLRLLHKRTPWSVGMYLKKGGISRYL
jgi:hypothetical protein